MADQRGSVFSCRAKDCGTTWTTSHNKALVCGWLDSQPITAYVGHISWQLLVATLSVASIWLCVLYVQSCFYAELFHVVNRRWGTELNRLEHDNKKLLADILSDTSRPLCSLYGAVVGLLAFGLRVRWLFVLIMCVKHEYITAVDKIYLLLLLCTTHIVTVSISVSISSVVLL